MRIIFKFTGGPMDGKTVVGEQGEQDEADRYYTLTNHGRVGQRFRTASQYAIDTLAREELTDERPHHFQEHIYRVSHRLEDDEKIFVRADYVRRDPERGCHR
jgi:hypothetical protein